MDTQHIQETFYLYDQWVQDAVNDVDFDYDAKIKELASDDERTVEEKIMIFSFYADVLMAQKGITKEQLQYETYTLVRGFPIR